MERVWDWVMPSRVVELLACWNGIHGCSQEGRVRKMISCVLCGVFIYIEKNEQYLNYKKCFLKQIWNFFVHSLLSWFSVLRNNGLSDHDFLMSLFVF